MARAPDLLIVYILTILSFSALVSADNFLASSGFTNCVNNPSITVSKANIILDKATGIVSFDAAGTSSQEQKVNASIKVTAYGQQVYQKSFDPCDNSTFAEQLCPVPVGTFAANGTQQIPSQYLNQIPAIAFTVPDINANAELHLTSSESGKEVACVQSGFTNGETLQLPAVPAVSGAILGSALLLAGFAAIGNAGAVGSSGPSPSFSTVFGWFQSMAVNGMLSVNYPPVYRSFTQNFAFSGGLIPWHAMQVDIDNFRARTGGNLSEDSVQYLQNTTLAFTDEQSNATNLVQRNLAVRLAQDVRNRLRDVSTSVGTSTAANSSSNTSSAPQYIVSGIEGYVEELTIPQANTFMTVLLIFATLVTAIIVGILGLKLILEVWALFASFPKRLTGFRKRYWRILANTITTMILLLYGIWTIWCIFQWTNGDSWAAKALAAITWVIFTLVLVFYTVQLWTVVRRHRRTDGDDSGLYEDADTWHKYSFLYDSYRRGYWWLFVPAILYMFAKGVVIAAGNGHGMTQTVAQLIIECLMFMLLLWSRPFATKGSNVINILVQAVRVLSVVCILVFVEQLGIAQTTKTVTGVILIAVQSALTGILGILLAVNTLRMLLKENPHKKAQKEAEMAKLGKEEGRGSAELGGNPMAQPKTPLMRDFSSLGIDRTVSRPPMAKRIGSSAGLLRDAASMGRRASHERGRSVGPDAGGASWPLGGDTDRQPTLPILDAVQPRQPAPLNVGFGAQMQAFARRPAVSDMGLPVTRHPKLPYMGAAAVTGRPAYRQVRGPSNPPGPFNAFN